MQESVFWNRISCG